MGKRKCSDVGAKHAGGSRRSGKKIYKIGDYVASGGQYTQCRHKSTGTTQVDNGRKPDASEYIQGRKLNGRRDRNNGSTNRRVAERCREWKYRTVSAKGGRKRFGTAVTTQEFWG